MAFNSDCKERKGKPGKVSVNFFKKFQEFAKHGFGKGSDDEAEMERTLPFRRAQSLTTVAPAPIVHLSAVQKKGKSAIPRKVKDGNLTKSSKMFPAKPLAASSFNKLALTPKNSIVSPEIHPTKPCFPVLTSEQNGCSGNHGLPDIPANKHGQQEKQTHETTGVSSDDQAGCTSGDSSLHTDTGLNKSQESYFSRSQPFRQTPTFSLLKQVQKRLKGDHEAIPPSQQLQQNPVTSKPPLGGTVALGTKAFSNRRSYHGRTHVRDDWQFGNASLKSKPLRAFPDVIYSQRFEDSDTDFSEYSQAYDRNPDGHSQQLEENDCLVDDIKVIEINDTPLQNPSDDLTTFPQFPVNHTHTMQKRAPSAENYVEQRTPQLNGLFFTENEEVREVFRNDNSRDSSQSVSSYHKPIVIPTANEDPNYRYHDTKENTRGHEKALAFPFASSSCVEVDEDENYHDYVHQDDDDSAYYLSNYPPDQRQRYEDQVKESSKVVKQNNDLPKTNAKFWFHTSNVTDASGERTIMNDPYEEFARVRPVASNGSEDQNDNGEGHGVFRTMAKDVTEGNGEVSTHSYDSAYGTDTVSSAPHQTHGKLPEKVEPHTSCTSSNDQAATLAPKTAGASKKLFSRSYEDIFAEPSLADRGSVPDQEGLADEEFLPEERKIRYFQKYTIPLKDEDYDRGESSLPRSSSLGNMLSNVETDLESTALPSSSASSSISGYSPDSSLKAKADPPVEVKRPSLYDIAENCGLHRLQLQDKGIPFKVLDTVFEAQPKIFRPPAGKVPDIIHSGSAFHPITIDEAKHRNMNRTWVVTVECPKSVPTQNNEPLQHGDFLLEVNDVYVANMFIDEVRDILSVFAKTEPIHVLVARQKSQGLNNTITPTDTKEYERLKFKYSKLKDEAETYLDSIADLRVSLQNQESLCRDMEEKLNLEKRRVEDLSRDTREKEEKVQESYKQVHSLAHEVMKLKKTLQKKTEKLNQLQYYMDYASSEDVSETHHSRQSSVNVSAV